MSSGFRSLDTQGAVDLVSGASNQVGLLVHFLARRKDSGEAPEIPIHHTYCAARHFHAAVTVQ